MILDSRQWAEIYNGNRNREDQKQALRQIIEGFLKETHQLVQMQDATEAGELFNILDDQQRKWNALVRKIDDDHPYPLNEKVFNRIIKKYDPKVAELWIGYKMSRHGLDGEVNSNKN